MRICLMVEGQEGVTWKQWRELAAACEQHGLEGLFRSDHYLSVWGDERRGSLDAWATLAGLAAITKELRLGTMVSPATFRHPSELAKVVTTVDHISGGRVELGLGAGWNEREHRAYGFEFPRTAVRIERFAEQLELIHRQWTEDEVDFSGARYRTERLSALPRPVQDPHPRLIVGGSARPGTVVPAVRFADEYNTVNVSPAEAADRRRRIDAACRNHGRDPATLVLSVMTACIIGSTDEEVRERTARISERIGHGEVDEFLRSHAEQWIAGTVEEAQARLRELEAVGVERIFLQHLDHEDLEAVALMGELV